MGYVTILGLESLKGGMKLTDRFTFGKHKGERLSSVIGSDPNYVEWCLEEIEEFRLTKGALERLEDALEQRYEAWDGVVDIYDFCD